MAALQDVFKKTMPTQMGYDWSGMSYQQEKAAQGVSPTTIFSLSFLVVFLIMAAQYESWTLPFSVLLGVPIAVFGAFVALYFRKLDQRRLRQIGLVMLIGLSAKNAILIVEFAKMEYDKGATLLDASLTGARLPLATDSDDRVRLHPGLRAAVGGDRAPAASRGKCWDRW